MLALLYLVNSNHNHCMFCPSDTALTLSQMEEKREMPDVIDDDEEEPKTPHSPMLKMTESANDDFQYSRPSSWVPT